MEKLYDIFVSHIDDSTGEEVVQLLEKNKTYAIANEMLDDLYAMETGDEFFMQPAGERK